MAEIKKQKFLIEIDAHNDMTTKFWKHGEGWQDSLSFTEDFWYRKIRNLYILLKKYKCRLED